MSIHDLGMKQGSRSLVRCIVVLLSPFYLVLAPPVFAISPAQVTGQTDVGRISNQLSRQPTYAPSVSPKPRVPTTNPEIAKENKIRFKLTKVTFIGNTVISTDVLNKIFASSINHEISLVDLEQMVHQVTVKYREDGYILSRAILPPQTIKNGEVKVQVIEGFVSSVEVKGNPGKAQKLLEAYGHHVMQSKPLRFQDLERNALIANDLPGYTIQTVLTPSKTVSAGADLTLVAERKKAAFFASYDNFGTRYIGPLETSAGVSLYSVFTGGDINTARFTVTSRTRELHFFELSHAQPLGSNGTRWLVGSNYAETRPEFILTPLEVVGRNFLVFTDLSYPWIRDRSKNLVLHGTANYQNVTSTILGGPFYQDRIRDIVLGFAFDNIDSYHGQNNLGIDVVKGFPILGAADHFYQSRPNGQAKYVRGTVTASRLQAIGSRYSLLAALHGQYSCEPLLATEQFGFGGPDFGRGYDPSEIVGDMGLALKLEFRIDTMPGFRFLQTVQYYTFVDEGTIWNRSTLGQPNRQSAMSTGIGARFNFMPALSGNFFIGKPLTRSVAVLDALRDNGKMARVFFQVSASI